MGFCSMLVAGRRLGLCPIINFCMTPFPHNEVHYPHTLTIYFQRRKNSEDYEVTRMSYRSWHCNNSIDFNRLQGSLYVLRIPRMCIN